MDRKHRSRGDFEQLYARFASDVKRWVRSLGSKDADRDDLVQDIFLLAFRRYEAFDGDNPGAWLYQIARRKLRDYRRLAWTKHVHAVGSLVPFENLLQHDRTPARDLEVHETAALLERLLAGLPVEQRVAFVQAELARRSGEEIARLQNVSLNTVWVRVHRARRKLREAARLESEPSLPRADRKRPL